MRVGNPSSSELIRLFWQPETPPATANGIIEAVGEGAFYFESALYDAQISPNWKEIAAFFLKVASSEGDESCQKLRQFATRGVVRFIISHYELIEICPQLETILKILQFLGQMDLESQKVFSEEDRALLRRWVDYLLFHFQNPTYPLPEDIQRDTAFKLLIQVAKALRFWDFLEHHFPLHIIPELWAEIYEDEVRIALVKPAIVPLAWGGWTGLSLLAQQPQTASVSRTPEERETITNDLRLIRSKVYQRLLEWRRHGCCSLTHHVLGVERVLLTLALRAEELLITGQL